MTDESSRQDRKRRFHQTVDRKAQRRIRARSRSDNVWFWLGMLGLVGWSVALPTVLGVVIGLWLDRVAPASFSWALSMLVIGLAVGLANAWFWVQRETADDGEPLSGEPGSPGATREVDGQ
jgi:ATP synthase protein I